MKKETLLVLFLVLLLPCVIYGSLNSFSSLDKDKTDPIDLIGDLKPPKDIRSAKIATSAITAEKQGNIIFVMFHEELGNIQVTITDEMGNEVIMQTVNSNTKPQVTIPLFGLPNGIYTIIFNNEQGEMYGDFEI